LIEKYGSKLQIKKTFDTIYYAKENLYLVCNGKLHHEARLITLVIILNI